MVLRFADCHKYQDFYEKSGIQQEIVFYNFRDFNGKSWVGEKYISAIPGPQNNQNSIVFVCWAIGARAGAGARNKKVTPPTGVNLPKETTPEQRDVL